MPISRVHWLTIAAFFSVAGAFAWGAPAREDGMRLESDSSRDILQTMAARKALAMEPALAHLNIGVTVRNRVAVLWGPVPTAEASFRAELCLRGMVELIEVRNELFIWEPLEPARSQPRFFGTPPAPPEQAPVKLPMEPRALPGAPGMFTGQDGSGIKHKSTNQIQVVPADRPSLPVLGPPQAEQAPEQTTAMTPQRDIGSAVRTLLQSKVRYRDVQFSIEAGRVYLRTEHQDSGALQEAAREIAQLPHVEGVIVLEKAAPR